jgi:hypothetical protein
MVQPGIHLAAVGLGEVINARPARVAIAVYGLDALAGNRQATAAKLGYEFRPIAASGLSVYMLALHGTAQQGGDNSKVARVVGA